MHFIYRVGLMHLPEMHVFGDEAFAAYGRNVTWFLSRQKFKFHKNILPPTLFVRPPCPLKYENGDTKRKTYNIGSMCQKLIVWSMGKYTTANLEP